MNRFKWFFMSKWKKFLYSVPIWHSNKQRFHFSNKYILDFSTMKIEIEDERGLIMDNWFVDKNKIKSETINAIMGELEYLLDELSEDISANYWIDSTHNVFAFINDNGSGDRWIEIHYELYDCNEDIICDLLVLNTGDVTREDLLEEVKMIVDVYYGD